MSIDLLNEKKLNPIFLHMDNADYVRPYPLSCYYVGCICERLFDLPIYRLAFLCDMILCYCDSSCTAPEQELTELLKGYAFPPAEEPKKTD